MNVQDIPMEGVVGPIQVEMKHGEVVINGNDERGQCRAIGSFRVEQAEGVLRLRAIGSLVLSLPQESDVVVSGTPDDVVLKNLRHVTMAECAGSLQARTLGSLHVEGPVSGHVIIKDVDGAVTLNEVHGNLTLRRVGTTAVEMVHGSASIKHSGDLTVESVQGSLAVRGGGVVRVRDVQGDASLHEVGEVHLESVQGDVALSHVSGSATLSEVQGDLGARALGPSLVATVEGDAKVRGPLTPGGEYTLRAAGDVKLRLEGNIRARLQAEGNLRVGEGWQQERGEDGTTHAALGEAEGAAQLTASAGGDLLLVQSDEGQEEHERPGPRPAEWKEWADMGERHEHVWDEHHAAFDGEADVNVQVEEEIRRAMEEVRTELKRAGETVRTELERTFRTAEESANGPVGQVMRGAVRDLVSALRPRPPVPPRAPQPPAPLRSAASGEEVRLILDMVSTGTLSAEEAEQLIAALG